MVLEHFEVLKYLEITLAVLLVVTVWFLSKLVGSLIKSMFSIKPPDDI